MNKEILGILKKKAIFLALVVAIIAGAVYFLGIAENAPIPTAVKNYKAELTLKDEIVQKNKELEQILADNKEKSEASKKATVKEFYKIVNSGDVINQFSPMFDNIITFIKQNGLRMKSIKYISSPDDDTLIKNGEGAYSGCRVDFELVGYYPQFTQFLYDLDAYPYFINIKKFEITPYQYDKRILIANVSIIFYSKR